MGDKKLQAGQYQFSRVSADGKIMLVSSVDVNTSVLQSTIGTEVLAAKNESITILFHVITTSGNILVAQAV